MSGSDASQGLEQGSTQGLAQDPAGGLTRAGASPAVPGVLELLDQVVESAVLVRPVWGTDGTVADFTIEHLSPGYVDPAGRPVADLTRQTLLTAYPGCDGWLLRLAAGVLASGAGTRVPGHVGGLLCGRARAVDVADLRAAAFGDGVVITWHEADRLQPEAASEDELAARLQYTLLPPDQQLAEAAGIDIAVRYRPAGGGHQVGGDWYDALPMPDGDLLLVVGDIAGHGVGAVTAMAGAREALRGLAGTGASPRDLLRQLNYGAVHLTDSSTGSVICGRYHPQSRVLRWARAGHLPPVLVRDGVARALDLPEGLLLGVDGAARYGESRVQLQPGDSLLLYTDGLIERRADSISDALADFVAAAVPAGPDADSHADRIMANAASDTGDDACLLAIRIL
ncbi:MAG TPA: PP2C family protein-serine/threonine phosphatase [Trebonia sp.]